jgi:chromosome segregation ATPase
MKYIIIGGVVAVAVAVCCIPALKGPINRIKNEANDKLNAEFVVDNYKAEYVNLYDKRNVVTESIRKYTVEKKVAEKKIEKAKSELEVIKKNIKETGTSDMKKFQSIKSLYEVKTTEIDNYSKMVTVYDNALKKLDRTLALIDTNMAKAKHNVEVLQSKKNMVDTIKSVNESIENINGVGDTDLAVNVEKLDDDMLRESVKLEALETENKPVQFDEASAKAWIDSL